MNLFYFFILFFIIENRFCNTASILYISLTPSRSHYIWDRSLAEALRENNHEVTLVSHFHENSSDNFTTIQVEGSHESLGLRNVRLHLPNAVQRGDKTVFRCLFDLEGDTLYSVKWYKGTREFYRYTPTDRPPHKFFPVPGHALHVQAEKSNASHLYLGPVDPTVGGRYSCEVSADAPSFHTALVSGETNIVDLPSHTPTISGIKPKYRLGDTLRGNCTSRDSKPAANLTWFINDQPVDSKYVKPVRKLHVGRSDLETSQVGLRFTVARHHFEAGSLKIRCSASVFNLYWKSTEKSADEEKPKLNIYNAETPNTLGVNQLPSPYDFYQPSNTYFDEDFPVPYDSRKNNVLNNHNVINAEVPTEESSAATVLVQWCTSVLLTITVILV